MFATEPISGAFNLTCVNPFANECSSMENRLSFVIAAQASSRSPQLRSVGH
jgi:hypothetical protein